MKSYLFKQIGNKFLAVEPLNSIFSDSDSSCEKVRSTNLTFSESECLELQYDEQIIVVQKTQTIIDAYNLHTNKLHKIQALNEAFNASKKITIQNGNTLVIKHDTPERGVFLEKLINVSKESLSNGISISYQQKVDNVMYIFSALPTVWSYVFKDLFLVHRKKSDGTLTGFKENSREYNKITFDAVALKIQNATTTQELNAISWNFANPNGVFINVNEKAEQMLNDSIVDNFTKSAINRLKDPETGEIHLINIV